MLRKKQSPASLMTAITTTAAILAGKNVRDKRTLVANCKRYATSSMR
jgi:hypothetical protein